MKWDLLSLSMTGPLTSDRLAYASRLKQAPEQICHVSGLDAKQSSATAEPPFRVGMPAYVVCGHSGNSREGPRCVSPARCQNNHRMVPDFACQSNSAGSAATSIGHVSLIADDLGDQSPPNSLSTSPWSMPRSLAAWRSIHGPDGRRTTASRSRQVSRTQFISWGRMLSTEPERTCRSGMGCASTKTPSFFCS